MDIHQAKELLQRYQQGNCTDSEKEWVENWYQQLIESGKWQWEEGEKDRMQLVLENRIMEQVTGSQVNYAEKRPLIRLAHQFWWAAASVILLVGIFGYFVFFHQSGSPEQSAKAVPNDINAPETNRATITLANGQKVFLDSVGNGALAVQGNVKLVKLDGGEIAYQHSSGKVSRKMEYNTLFNPRGSRVIHMVLADGSKVWLNAGSALTYPVAFVGKERKVSISGEAYFEIAHDASKPFTVHKGSVDIRVLGTHFNVNAFEDDGQDLEVTLLEGSVKINNGKESGLLKPGQQARVSSQVKVVSDVDLEAVMAWKNGFFYFDHASLQNVLSQVSRWYDVNVIYKGNNQPRQFAGEIQRDLSLSEVLTILEKNKVHFKIEGKELIVLAD